MKAEAQFVRVDELEVALTLTMTLKAWKELSACITQRWPGIELQKVISNMVEQIEGKVSYREVSR